MLRVVVSRAGLSRYGSCLGVQSYGATERRASRASAQAATRRSFQVAKNNPAAVSALINCRLASVASECPCWQRCRDPAS
jgi:hypothetical protein